MKSDLIQPEIPNSKDEQKISLPSIGIPGEVLFNPFLTSTEKILFGLIRNLSKSSRGCWASNAFLGSLINRHESRVSALLSHMRLYGYIEIQEVKKSNGTERQIRETLIYHDIYSSLVLAFHDNLNSCQLSTILEDMVRKICSPDQPQKFDEKKGLWTAFEKDSSLEEVWRGLLKIIGGVIKNNKLYKEEDSNSLKDSKESFLNGPDGPASKILSSNRFRRDSTRPIQPSENLLKKNPAKDYIVSGTEENIVVNVWNTLLRPAAKHTQLNTRSMRRAAEYLTQMRVGTFGDPGRRRWNGDWMAKHKIDARDFAEKKWRVREICQVIGGPLANMYKEGYWPEKKDGLPRSLTDALYNPRTQSSFFMLAYYDPPGPLRSWVKDPHKGITEDLAYLHIVDQKKMSAGDWKKYSAGIGAFASLLKEVDWGNYGARQMFPGGRDGNPYSLVMEYVKWLRGESTDLQPMTNYPEALCWYWICPDYWAFRKFMEAVNKYWGWVFRCIRSGEE